MANQLYLSRRNLLTLLSKLDRVKNGEDSYCAIIKNDTQHKDFPATISNVWVFAVEDEDYYLDRLPGDVLPKDTPK